MSVRRATPPGKGAPSRRLDEVLRAGVAVGRPVDESESGLTRALKQASITPTGACVARTFDPDYCAYDQYYTIGVAVVSATLGVLAETRTLSVFINAGIDAVREALGRQCHVPQAENPDGYFFSAEPNPQAKRFDQMNRKEADDAIQNFSFLCKTLDSALYVSQPETDERKVNIPAIEQTRVDTMDTLSRVAHRLVEMLIIPARMAMVLAHNLAETRKPAPKPWTLSRDDQEFWQYRQMYEDHAFVVHSAGLATLAWTLKYVSRYLNEHALMIASFFRVNAKRLDNGEPALLDLSKFVQMCKNDIADGANPPPAPPAYEEFDPEADAERRRLAELRARRDARDPLMAGLDYPETYASARNA